METIEPTILVVDDTEDNLDLLEFALKRKPVKMVRASSGKECLSIAEKTPPDVILLDIQMPEMDGFETLKRLRESPRTAGIPVIFLTAQRKDAVSIERGLMMGADEYLTKPIDTEELIVRTRTLVHLKRVEAELERTKADFTAMLVHDLRSPIMGIKSILEFIREPLTQEKTLDATQVNLVHSAHDAAERMLLLINDMLDLSKFEAGKIHLHLEKFALRDLLDFLSRQMSIQMRQKEVEYETAVDPSLPDVHADSQKIGQVVTNILSNALKFTHPGGKIRVSARPCPGDGTPDGAPLIEVLVENEGPGIQPDELPHIFEKYKQLSLSRTAKEKGTGLGLAICKMIIEAHGGSIRVESEPGKTTTFRFTVPAVRP